MEKRKPTSSYVCCIQVIIIAKLRAKQKKGRDSFTDSRRAVYAITTVIHVDRDMRTYYK